MIFPKRCEFHASTHIQKKQEAISEKIGIINSHRSQRTIAFEWTTKMSIPRNCVASLLCCDILPMQPITLMWTGASNGQVDPNLSPTGLFILKKILPSFKVICCYWLAAPDDPQTIIIQLYVQEERGDVEEKQKLPQLSLTARSINAKRNTQSFASASLHLFGRTVMSCPSVYVKSCRTVLIR